MSSVILPDIRSTAIGRQQEANATCIGGARGENHPRYVPRSRHARAWHVQFYTRAYRCTGCTFVTALGRCTRVRANTPSRSYTYVYAFSARYIGKRMNEFN